MKRASLVAILAVAWPLFADDVSQEHYHVHTYSVNCIKRVKEFDLVLFHMQKHLAVMQEIARYKWNHGLGVEFTMHDAENIARGAAKAEALGMNREWLITFLEAQIEAGLMIQRQCFQSWGQQGAGHFEKCADLETELQPYAAELLDELITALARVYPEMTPDEKECLKIQEPLSKRYFDALDSEVWNVAVLPLRTVFDIQTN